MKTPPLTGPILRIGVALLLCAACFQAGRWYQELASPAGHRAAARHDPGNEMVSATFLEPATAEPKTVEPTPLVSAGDPVGEPSDIITPLNVRDPSALVMGPSQSQCPQPPAAEPTPQAKPMDLLESRRLLELLRRGRKKDPAPDKY